MGNTFGHLFRVTTFGESHGPALGVVIDGVPAGVELDTDALQRDLDRRRPGRSAAVSARCEADRAEIVAGLFGGRTTGAPLCMLFRNDDARSKDYDHLRDRFRPGHADFSWFRKYGIRDHRGGGRSSGRETVARVAAGAVARQLLLPLGVTIAGRAVEIAGVRDDEAAQLAAIEAARTDGDSVGGVVEVVAAGVPAGWGDPVFDKLDARLAYALMGIGAVKAVEIGDGFGLARLRGSQANDALTPDGPATNRAGGILGGVSTGAPIVVRLAVKPTPSIAAEQDTVDVHGAATVVAVGGRHDPCVVPRLVPVAEAMTALVLVDGWLRQRAVRRD